MGVPNAASVEIYHKEPIRTLADIEYGRPLETSVLNVSTRTPIIDTFPDSRNLEPVAAPPTRLSMLVRAFTVRVFGTDFDTRLTGEHGEIANKAQPDSLQQMETYRLTGNTFRAAPNGWDENVFEGIR